MAEPKFKIPKIILTQGFYMLAPAGAFWWFYARKYTLPEDEREELIRRQFPAQVRRMEAQQAKLQAVLDKALDGDEEVTDVVDGYMFGTGANKKAKAFRNDKESADKTKVAKTLSSETN